MSLHLSLKAKLIVTAAAAKELKSTMDEFNKACNTLSHLAFELNLHRRYDIHHSGYHLIRTETNLPAQHVINAITKVSAQYVREPDTRHRFKPHSSVRYDSRTMVIGPDAYTAALTVCPKGRVTGQLQMSAKMRKTLGQGEMGSAELVYRQGTFYLHISVNLPDPVKSDPSGTLGVDLGVKRVAVTSDQKFYAAPRVRHQKACYKRTRKHLQANGSKSAKRVLRRVSGREGRFMSDVNHGISKKIVEDAKANDQRIVLEDLTGIRETGKAKCVQDWSFFQLRQYIEYKAKRSGVKVAFVEPRYTSIGCSRCLHLGKRPTQSLFCCPSCGLRLNADLNASRSIAVRHDLIAMGRYFCEYSAEKVNRPEAVRPRRVKSSGVNTKLGTASPHDNCEAV